MIVILKDRHNTNMSDSANFRGIALSSIFGEVFGNIILERYHQKLSSCDMQFGFKPKTSTSMCSMVKKEVVSYYVQHQSHWPIKEFEKGGHMASAERKPIMGVWGLCPQWGPGANPLVRGLGDFAPWSWTYFYNACIYTFIRLQTEYNRIQ